MKKIKKLLSVILCISLVLCLLNGSVLTTNAVTQADIDRLKEQNASDEAVLSALNDLMTDLMGKINSNNARINEYNAAIDANNAAIAETQAEIEKDKGEFCKRIRSIYMSNSESRIKILLGAESFSQFLQLAQLTASVSSHDKKLIEELAAKIQVLEQKNKENEEMLAELNKVKADLDSQYAELSAKQEEAQAIFDRSASLVEEAERKMEEERRRQQNNSGSANAPSFNGSAYFRWPSDFTYVSAGFSSNDSVHNGVHNGIDIAGGGIYGTPIYAIGDGYVTYVANSCPHDFGKNWGCGCGGNYGRYAQISHGTVDGNTYSAVYAHSSNIIVSPGQYVERGQIIGYVGTTGWSTGPHLHLGIIRNGAWINPLEISFAY